jgi:hypothetical protein
MGRIVTKLGQTLERTSTRRGFIGRSARVILGTGAGLTYWATFGANKAAAVFCCPCTPASGTWCSNLGYPCSVSNACHPSCSFTYQWICCCSGWRQICTDCNCPNGSCGCQKDTDITCTG